MAAMMAVILAVSRPAFPSEDAHEGSGLVIVALWGVVALVWALARVSERRFRWFAGPADVCVAVLIVAVIVAASRATALRPAINMASEWAGLALSFFLVRQLFRDAPSQRLLVTAMLAMALAVAAYGIYQAFWELESLRARYNADPAAALQKLGFRPGTHEQRTFENRLRSHEPFATFALANSLAGFLLAWLPLGIAWLVDRQIIGTSNRPSRLNSIAGGAMVLGTVVCLVLTQSRTAYVALALELVALGAYFGIARWRRGGISARALRGAAVAAAVAVLIVAVTVVVAVRRGKLDEKLFTQATKSLSYRLEYWRGTLGLIRDHVWLGVGPGNFQSEYLRYKLAESSEEIADPHNMLLEVWATSGAIACVALAATFALACWRMARAANDDEPITRIASLEMKFVPLIGLVLATLIAPMDLSRLSALAIVWLAGASIFSAMGARRPAGPVVAIAVVGLAVHLLGAGGIAMPAVSQSLWLLLAVGSNIAEGARPPVASGGAGAARLAAATLAVIVASFGYFVVRPVTSSRAGLVAARDQLARGDAVGALLNLDEAVRLDPLAPEPWIGLARIYSDRWRHAAIGADRNEFNRALDAVDHAIALAPARIEFHTEAALLCRQARFWSRAIAEHRTCVELYPTSARANADLADALWEAGERDAARAATGRALELDARTPHADKKLDDRVRALLQSRLDEERPASPTRLHGPE